MTEELKTIDTIGAAQSVGSDITEAVMIDSLTDHIDQLGIGKKSAVAEFDHEHGCDDKDVVSYQDIMTEEYECNDCRIAMIGNVDSGKSTLIGVLTNSS